MPTEPCPEPYPGSFPEPCPEPCPRQAKGLLQVNYDFFLAEVLVRFRTLLRNTPYGRSLDMAEFTLWFLKLSEKIEKEDYDQVVNPTRCYMGTSLIRNIAPLGPYRRTMRRALW